MDQLHQPARGIVRLSKELTEAEAAERLARLAARSQVLVVTHSPQVAARAAHHYRIEKHYENGSTRTHVRKLSAEERREEIARMLSGASVTEEARAQAARLLEAA